MLSGMRIKSSGSVRRSSFFPFPQVPRSYSSFFILLEIGGVPRNLTHPTVHDGSVVRSSHYDIISKQLFIAGVFSRFGERISIQKASVASPNFGRFNTTDYTWHPTENRTFPFMLYLHTCMGTEYFLLLFVADEYASPKFVTSKGSEPFVLSTIVSQFVLFRLLR